MPKFDLGINGMDQGGAQGREAWGGELPPTGNYEGVLTTVMMDVITGKDSPNKGKKKMLIGVELKNTEDGKYDGFVAFGNLNLIDESIPFVNQFLMALTDGTDAQFEKIKEAFYGGGLRVDDRQKHVTDIGAWKVNSPKGTLPIKVAIKNKPFWNEKTNTTTDQARIKSYLVGEGTVPAGGASDGSIQDAVVEEANVELVDESLLD